MDANTSNTILAAFLGAFFAAVLGIPAGLYADRVIKKFQGKKEKRQLVEALTDSIKGNLKLVKDKLEKELEKETIDIDPYVSLYSADLTLLNSTALKKYELLSSIPTCQAIDKAKYALINLDIQVDVMRRITAAWKGDAGVQHKMFQRTVDGCKEEIPKVKESLETALKKLKDL